MLGLTAFVQGLSYLNEREPLATGYLLIGAVALVVGASLVIGFMTPINALVVFLSIILPLPTILAGARNIVFESNLTIVYVSISAIAVALLGPGAFSLDARLFGRREIIIPGKTGSPK